MSFLVTGLITMIIVTIILNLIAKGQENAEKGKRQSALKEAQARIAQYGAEHVSDDGDMKQKKEEKRGRGEIMDSVIPHEVIERKILVIRGKRVMLDKDLAALYEVTTGNLNKAVKRNIDRFPEDFMFQLTQDEADQLLRFQIGTLKRGQHFKYLPYAFTENGVSMLSSVLNSTRAVHVNIEIMRTFTRLREMLLTHRDLRVKLAAMEKKYDHQFKIVFDTIKQLLEPPQKPKKRIGFRSDVE